MWYGNQIHFLPSIWYEACCWSHANKFWFSFFSFFFIRADHQLRFQSPLIFTQHFFFINCKFIYCILFGNLLAEFYVCHIHVTISTSNMFQYHSLLLPLFFVCLLSFGHWFGEESQWWRPQIFRVECLFCWIFKIRHYCQFSQR